jgi:hypothetical protein
MASVYDNSPNIFKSEFKQISLTDSGTFSLSNETAKKITIFNDAGYKVRVYKTNNFDTTTSGTSSADGVFIGVEDGISYTIPGVGHGDQISVQKDVHTNPTFSVKYILEK